MLMILKLNMTTTGTVTINITQLYKRKYRTLNVTLNRNRNADNVTVNYIGLKMELRPPSVDLSVLIHYISKSLDLNLQ